MEEILSLLSNRGLAPALVPEKAAAVADLASRLSSATVYPASLTAVNGLLVFLARRNHQKVFGMIAATEEALRSSGARGDTCDISSPQMSLCALLCEPSHENAAALRDLLPFTAPRTLGLRKSVGCGDRLGITTPGHIRGVRGSGLAGIFAQQSIREMARTQRTAEQVMDDASWGVFQEGYRDGFGSDADHLKTTTDIDTCLAAGFTMFTIDPGAHVDNAADQDEGTILTEKAEKLPWYTLESCLSDCRQAYLGKPVKVAPGVELAFTEEKLLRAAAKYGSAVAHTTKLYRYLETKKGGKPFELEVSVDETATPTSVLEHYFVAGELKRLGVKWVSLAPRFVGSFEKGVDYIGGLDQFEKTFAQHAAIASALGPYKISLHSGSDKFSIYPIIARLAGELFHLKTAGTSYLEALRVVAITDPRLFREILAFAIERYPEDRASYHVSADPAKVPTVAGLRDVQLAGVLDTFDGREVLHVTFGSVLNAKDDNEQYLYRERLFETLKGHEETYYAAIAKHIGRHIAPFRK